MRALVIDDDPDIVRLLDIKLSKEGHEVRTEVDGTAGRRAIGEFRPEVLVLETEVPGKHGLEVIREAKALKTSPIVVVLSHLDSDEAITAAFDAGADDYVTKPFSPRVVGERLRIAALRRA